MTSVQNKLPAQYRQRAKEARERAAATTDEAVRTRILHDAEQWEKMAEYEEQAGPRS